MIDHNRLRSVLHYDPETGVFSWKLGGRNALAVGSVAGSLWSDRRGRKYRYIKIFGRTYAAHRLAWLYVHGTWPSAHIDHIDRNGLNNAIANLREATTAENSQNRIAPAHNTSGFKGVSWHKRRRKWIARIGANGRVRHLGYFSTAEEASCAYEAASSYDHGAFRGTQ